jgi:hypothetical protein
MARELIAIAIALVTACGRDTAAKPGAKPAATASAPLAGKPFYRVDRGPEVACARGAVCEAGLVLTALGGYHVNKDYPFKFVGDPAATVQIDGPGTFAMDGEQRGMLTVKFRTTQPGTAKLVGTFKLSVCSDENCEIEAPKLELGIPVS